ncbi:MAG: hypothetical protein NTX50_20895 [Candidatus Sumerlaeota bacterium]|nr:hypothetical protein [Candidatus Sumerlaeota bacterium]
MLGVRKRSILSIALLLMALSSAAFAQTLPPQQSRSGPFPPAGCESKTAHVAAPGGASRTISGVPGYAWRHGCGPTAVGMVIGYYDRRGCDDLIPGDASTQTDPVNQAMASQGSGTRGTGTQLHYEDYSLPDDSASGSVIPDSSVNYPAGCHTNNCIADFMRTSWSSDGNFYGWSWSNKIAPAFISYVNLRNSLYEPTITQYNWGGTLTWNVLTNEIDNNRPMVFLVDSDGDNVTDHFVTVIAYSDSPTQQYGCLDTWGPDYSQIRWCEFRGMSTSYSWGIWGGWALHMNCTLSVDQQNAGSGATIGVYPLDIHNNGDGTALFTRVYENSANVTLTAPAKAPSGNDFHKWQLNGADFAGNTALSVPVTITGNCAMTAVYYNQARTLTVASSNPDSGISVTISPADRYGAANGTTQFTRTYDNLTVVSLTAPPVWGATRVFLKWQKNGADFPNNASTSINVTMDADYVMTAVYQPTPRLLTVASTNPDSGTSITISPADNNGAGSGLTRFTRTYGHGTVVTLIAPRTTLTGARTFSKWLCDGDEFTSNTSPGVLLTMDADYTMTAVYVPTPRAVTVASSNPDSGVPVALSPADKSGAANGATPFGRTFDDGTQIYISAPLITGGNVLSRWMRDAADLTTQAAVQTLIDADTTLTAVYVTPDRTVYPLSVAAILYGGAAPIVISPADYRGSADGLTPLTRVYRSGDSVTLTAPANCDGGGIAYRFRAWVLDGVIQSTGLNASVTMDAAHSLQAVFMPDQSQAKRTLLVTSINPGAGVPIALDTEDQGGNAAGVTPFNRTYDVASRAVVALSAPAKAGDTQFFRKWLLDDGAFLGDDQRTVKIPIGASHIVSAVYETRTTCTLIADSADPDSGVALGVSLADVSGAKDGVTDLRRVYDVFTTVTLTAPPTAQKDGRPYAFYKWLRNGKNLDGATSSAISVCLTEDVAFTAVYAGDWFEDYIIAYSDATKAHKFRYQMGHPKYGVPPAGIVSAGEGIVIPYEGAGAIGSLSVTPNRKALQGRAPRTIPQIKTAGGFSRVLITGTVARKYAGAVEAARMIKSLTIIGGYAMDVRAIEIGSVRMTAPNAIGNRLTAVHSATSQLAPTSGRQFLCAAISLAGVSLAELDAPYQPVRVLAQTKRYAGLNPMVLPSSLGLTTTTLRAAIAGKISVIGGGIGFGGIASRLPSDIGLACYPRGRDVSIATRLQTFSGVNYPAHILSREINVQGGLRLTASGGDIGGAAAGDGDAFPARIIAGGKIYGVSAMKGRKSGVGGYLGLRPATGEAATTIPPAIAIIAGSGATGTAGGKTASLCDVASANGSAGMNAWFFAGAATVSCDPCVAPDPAYSGNLHLQPKTQEPNAIHGAAFVSKPAEKDLILRLRKLGTIISPDFQVNGKKLSEW